MSEQMYVPHIEVLMHALRISPERLASRSKVAIDTRLLRALLQELAAAMPFDPAYYLAENDDIRTAHTAGQIPDLRRHFIESGLLEGRFGALPKVDEAYYAATYKDIAPAIRRGDIASGADHYVRSGAAEGRVPHPDLRPQVERWASILGD